jgi:5-methyltetrahydrofolate corrinoid/iron sulfur protein methyltransferase
MILIGESIHMISDKIRAAVDRRDPVPIQALARLQAQGGADYLDLNLGPLTKDPAEIAAWVVETVQEVVDLPLSIDTLNPVALEAALKVCKRTAVINSVNKTERSQETILPLVSQYGTEVILMTIGDQGMAREPDERLDMAMELVEIANGLGIPSERIWVDAVLMPVCIDQEDILRYFEFIRMFPEALPDAKTLTGLSNISSCGAPDRWRGILNRTFFIMINRYGHSGVIADVFDQDLIKLNRGELTQIVELVYRAMDEEEINLQSLTETGRQYVKTVQVIMGRQFYSHAWLEE